MCRIAGWGLTEKSQEIFPEKLHEVSVPIRDINDCAANYAIKKGKVYKKLSICAGGDTRDSCSVRAKVSFFK